METGRELKTLQGHTRRVNAVALSSNGHLALSGSFDNTLKLWDLETGKVFAEFTAEGPISAAGLSSKKLAIMVGDRSGRVHFLTLENPGVQRLEN